MSELEPQAFAPAPASAGAGAIAPKKRRRYSLLSRRDKTLLAVMVGVPLFVFLVLIWSMTVVSVGLSLTDWDGVQAIRFVGIDNYTQLFTTYPFFWPAVAHNVMWLLFFVCIATPLGILLAVLLDRPLRGSGIYQSVFFIPVVLSLAVVGFIWELQYNSLDGFINSALVGTGLVSANSTTDWLGDSSVNIWAVLIAASWRHIGYIMVLYLAGLKGCDPSLEEAAEVDGAGWWQRLRYIVIPQLRNVNTVIFAVTVIDSLRTFDIVWAMTRGGPYNSTQLLSTYMYQVGFTQVNLGYGSAIAVVIFLLAIGFIITYLARATREEN